MDDYRWPIEMGPDPAVAPLTQPAHVARRIGATRHGAHAGRRRPSDLCCRKHLYVTIRTAAQQARVGTPVPRGTRSATVADALPSAARALASIWSSEACKRMRPPAAPDGARSMRIRTRFAPCFYRPGSAFTKAASR